MPNSFISEYYSCSYIKHDLFKLMKNGHTCISCNGLIFNILCNKSPQFINSCILYNLVYAFVNFEQYMGEYITEEKIISILKQNMDVAVNVLRSMHYTFYIDKTIQKTIYLYDYVTFQKPGDNDENVINAFNNIVKMFAKHKKTLSYHS